MTSTPALEIRDLTVEYPLAEGGVFTAVEGVSLSIAPGEIHALVGESGAGKTTIGNAALGLEASGARRADAERAASEQLARFGLAGFGDAYPAQLSGGMRQRAAFLRTILPHRELLLFDEPFGALDEITRERLNEELMKLFMRERFAGLFITHSVYEAVFLSTRVLVMSARPGRIIAEFEIPFEFPRPADLRFDPEFARLTGEVSHGLRGAHA